MLSVLASLSMPNVLKGDLAEQPVPYAIKGGGRGAPAALDGHLRPKARVMVWVMPPPLRCLAVIRMDT